jgi:hypothetical protein
MLLVLIPAMASSARAIELQIVILLHLMDAGISSVVLIAGIIGPGWYYNYVRAG